MTGRERQLERNAIGISVLDEACRTKRNAVVGRLDAAPVVVESLNPSKVKPEQSCG